MQGDGGRSLSQHHLGEDNTHSGEVASLLQVWHRNKQSCGLTFVGRIPNPHRKPGIKPWTCCEVTLHHSATHKQSAMYRNQTQVKLTTIPPLLKIPVKGKANRHQMKVQLNVLYFHQMRKFSFKVVFLCFNQQGLTRDIPLCWCLLFPTFLYYLLTHKNYFHQI